MRDALRIWKTSGTSNQSGQPYLDEVNDEELGAACRAAGYIKIDVNVNHVLEDFEHGDWHGMPHAQDAIRQVIEAYIGKGIT